jgi:hypothetical protein
LEGILAAEQSASVLLGASENTFTKDSLFLVAKAGVLAVGKVERSGSKLMGETKQLGCSASTPVNSSGLNIPTKIVRLGRTKSSDTFC